MKEKTTVANKTSETVMPDHVWDTYKNGKLESRSINKGETSFSMRYDQELGVFFGDVSIATKLVYNSSEYVSDTYANLPYPELNALRDLLLQEWRNEIKEFLSHPKKKKEN